MDNKRIFTESALEALYNDNLKPVRQIPFAEWLQEKLNRKSITYIGSFKAFGSTIKQYYING